MPVPRSPAWKCRSGNRFSGRRKDHSKQAPSSAAYMYMHVPRGRLVAGLDHDDRLVTVRLLENVARAENLRYHSHQCGSLERML
jgi:hypothetical protein